MGAVERPDLSGILVIDKPAGMTSHDVVARVRRAARMRRVGHGGTLDPFATGVLPVAVGPATRILQYVQSSEKVYAVTAELGRETDSGDIDGSVIATAIDQVWPDRAVVEHAISGFRGEIEQVPPALSAIKVDGQPLHRRVRAGEDVSPPPRLVIIHEIGIDAYEPPYLQLRVRCGSGTYVRALVRDIGRTLGIYAYCRALRRERTGPFSLEASVTLDQLEQIDCATCWESLALPMDAAVAHLPCIQLHGDASNGWYHGRSQLVVADDDGQPLVMRVYDASGRFAGIGRRDPAGSLRPTLVLPPAEKAGSA